VRRYLLSEDEVRSNGTFGDNQTVREKFPDLDLITTQEAASAFFRTDQTISRIMKRHGLRKYRYGRGNQYLIDREDLRRVLLA
jgi:excisionase family DNA binding protein